MIDTYSKIEIKAIKEILEINWANLQQYCNAVYIGGSRLDPVIDHPHDYDFICFAKPLQRHFLAAELSKMGFTSRGSGSDCKQNALINLDFSQCRIAPYTEISWFSYLDILMEKLIGEDVCPKTDIINKHRNEFKQALLDKTMALVNGKIKNQKRWYHILRGTYILINNSYKVDSRQREEINILHDLSDGWETIRDKTISLLTNLN